MFDESDCNGDTGISDCLFLLTISKELSILYSNSLLLLIISNAFSTSISISQHFCMLLEQFNSAITEKNINFCLKLKSLISIT